MNKNQSIWNCSKIHSALGAAILLISLVGCSSTPHNPYLETTYVHKYGMSVDQDYWAASGRNGEVISTLRDGSCETCNYENGLLHGRRSMTFPFSQQLKFIEDYDSDICIRRQTFLECGSPDCCTDYTNDGCFTLTYWYNCGSPRCVEKYADGKLVEAEYYDMQHQRESAVSHGEGERIHRDRFGQFVYLDKIQNGYLCTRTVSHPNGTTKEIIPYDTSNNISGLKRTYHPDGSPNTIEAWAYGNQQGITTVYQNGERFADIPYNNGKKHGVERRFKDGEVVTQEVSWEDGQMHGPMHSYTNNTVQSDWYYKGRLTTRANYESFNMPRKPIN